MVLTIQNEKVELSKIKPKHLKKIADELPVFLKDPRLESVINDVMSDLVDEDQLMGLVLSNLTVMLDLIYFVVSVLTDKDIEFVENMDLEELIDVIKNIFTINNFGKLIKDVKTVKNLLAPQTARA